MHMYLKLFVEMGLHVVFVPDNYYRFEPYISDLQAMGIPVIYGPFNFGEWIKEHGKYIHYAFLSRPHIAIKYIEPLLNHTQAKLLYYTHDLHFLRELRRYEIEKNDEILKKSQWFQELEFRIFDQVHTILTPSQEEVGIIKHHFPSKQVLKILGYFYDTFPPNPTSKDPFQGRDHLLFVGGFNHPPNIDAVEYFIKDIFPLIQRRLPEAKLYVVGSDPPERIQPIPMEGSSSQAM